MSELDAALLLAVRAGSSTPTLVSLVSLVSSCVNDMVKVNETMDAEINTHPKSTCPWKGNQCSQRKATGIA